MPKLKGDYNGGTSYSVDDVVRWTNGEIYTLLEPCSAGTPCTDTLHWGKILDAGLAGVVSMMIDLMNATSSSIAEVTAAIPTNINDESIVLKSGDNEYLVSVDATGDTPEVIAELIEEEAAEGGET